MKIFIIILIIIVFLLIIFTYLISNYICNSVISNKSKGITPYGSSLYKSVKTSTKRDNDWFFLNSHNVYLKSFDKLKLHAYEIKNHKNKWAILIHGYKDNPNALIKVARKFNKFGYNVLIPSLRGHGKSEGNYVGMGFHDSKDIHTWINYLNKKGNILIVIYGFSMGATTAMITAGDNPLNVKLVIEDSGYDCCVNEFKYQLKSLYHLPGFPFIQMASLINRINNKYSFKDCNAIEAVQKTNLPILFIHGKKDTFVPYEMAINLYDKKKNKKNLYLVDQARHIESEQIDSKKYWSLIEKELDKYVK